MSKRASCSLGMLNPEGSPIWPQHTSALISIYAHLASTYISTHQYLRSFGLNIHQHSSVSTLIWPQHTSALISIYAHLASTYISTHQYLRSASIPHLFLLVCKPVCNPTLCLLPAALLDLLPASALQPCQHSCRQQWPAAGRHRCRCCSSSSAGCRTQQQGEAARPGPEPPFLSQGTQQQPHHQQGPGRPAALACTQPTMHLTNAADLEKGATWRC